MCCQHQSYSADEWDVSRPAGTESVSDLDTLLQTNNEALDRVLSTHIQGLFPTKASDSTLSISVGSVVCSNSDGSVRKFRANTSATSVAWTDIDTGAEAASTTYYLFAVADTDATTFTVLISTSSTTPTGATYYANIGSFYNNVSSNIEAVRRRDSQVVEMGSWDSKTNNTAYYAETGGFVLYVSVSSASDQTVYFYMDSTDASTQVIYKYNRTSVGLNNSMSIMVPVPKGQFWKIDGTPGGSETGGLWWIPLEVDIN